LLVSPAEPVSHLFRLRPAAGPVERNGIMTTKKCAATAADPLSDVLAEAKVMKADFEEQAEQWVKEWLSQQGATIEQLRDWNRRFDEGREAYEKAYDSPELRQCKKNLARILIAFNRLTEKIAKNKAEGKPVSDDDASQQAELQEAHRLYLRQRALILKKVRIQAKEAFTSRGFPIEEAKIDKPEEPAAVEDQAARMRLVGALTALKKALSSGPLNYRDFRGREVDWLKLPEIVAGGDAVAGVRTALVNGKDDLDQAIAPLDQMLRISSFVSGFVRGDEVSIENLPVAPSILRKLDQLIGDLGRAKPAPGQPQTAPVVEPQANPAPNAPAGYGWFTKQKAADFVDVTERTMWNWLTGRTGKLTLYHSEGNLYLLSLAELEAHKEAQAKKKARISQRANKTSH